MVRVWYEPPPYGPGTDLNRSGYGIGGGGAFRSFIERASKMNQPLALGGMVLFSMVICYIPVSTLFLGSLCCFWNFFAHIGNFNSEPKASIHDGPGVPSCFTCLHALPQHEPHLWN